MREMQSAADDLRPRAASLRTASGNQGAEDWLQTCVRRATDFEQRNEKQTLYLDTARGALSGSIRVTFTDSFGQRWTTTDVDINPRLSGRGYINAADTTTVTFSPSLAHGELEIGDFLIIGDERHEVINVYPLVTSATKSRPTKLGGVIDSVSVRTGFAITSTRAHAFRADAIRGQVERRERTVAAQRRAERGCALVAEAVVIEDEPLERARRRGRSLRHRR